jgi:hypothetical protein
MSDPEPPKKRRGCFFYGCITSLVVALVLVLIVGFVVAKIVGYANAQIVQYTDTAPVPLPKADLPSNELAQLEARVSAFVKALDAHSNTPPLTLNTAEVNALLENTEQVQALKLKDRFYITLQGDQIKAQISLPLGDFPKPPFIKTDGRFLNGDAVVVGSVTNSQVSLTIKSMDVKGSPLPLQYLARVQAFQDAMMTNVNNNPTNRAVFDHLDSAEVKDGVLTIKPKP